MSYIDDPPVVMETTIHPKDILMTTLKALAVATLLIASVSGPFSNMNRAE